MKEEMGWTGQDMGWDGGGWKGGRGGEGLQPPNFNSWRRHWAGGKPMTWVGDP